MRYSSLYLDWYNHVPNIKYDFRSSGILPFRHNLMLGEVNLNINYTPYLSKLLAKRYDAKPENIFLSTDGASGQNSRIIRYIAEKDGRKREAVVEYPTYEPLLRQTQEHFPRIKRIERREKDSFSLDADALRKVVSEKTGLLVLTNPHAPSGTITQKSELKEIMTVAQEYKFYVLCDEIYAEFERDAIPTVFSVNEELGIVSTSFTKAYGLGGLKLGIALANKNIVNDLYADLINTAGGASNIVQLIALELLTKDKEILERHKEKWISLKKETEKWLNEKGLEFSPNKISITYWVKTPVKDTYTWINNHAIPRYSLAAVPGTFFLFKNNYKLVKSNMVRLGLGNLNPSKHILQEALENLEKAIKTYC
ncbi:MAG: pyridoxal phosphate-dependent aminotransferase [Candidatus Bathyarchaeota archaeon]|nr:pyridoxal phosphate-dependent aminotransferase [Candidatus Bathyarchaeota archaeon]